MMYEGRTDSDLRALSMPAVAALAASGPPPQITSSTIL